MQKLWFKRKSYGWGWSPCSWQGWVVISAYVIFLTWNALRLDHVAQNEIETVTHFIPETIIATMVLLVITYFTGESPRWQWGEPKTKKKKS